MSTEKPRSAHDIATSAIHTLRLALAEMRFRNPAGDYTAGDACRQMLDSMERLVALHHEVEAREATRSA